MDAFYVDYLERLAALHRDFVRCVDGLPQAALDWTPGPDMNSLCVLVVHITGAERYWVGDVALGDPSGRDRDAEFRARGLDATALKGRLAASEAYIRAGLERLPVGNLTQMRDAPGRSAQFSVGWALLHALEHTALHLGHAEITRQLWDQQRP